MSYLGRPVACCNVPCAYVFLPVVNILLPSSSSSFCSPGAGLGVVVSVPLYSRVVSRVTDVGLGEAVGGFGVGVLG